MLLRKIVALARQMFSGPWVADDPEQAGAAPISISPPDWLIDDRQAEAPVIKAVAPSKPPPIPFDKLFPLTYANFITFEQKPCPVCGPGIFHATPVVKKTVVAVLRTDYHTHPSRN